MLSLHSCILNLKQGHSEYGHNGLLFAMSLEESEVIDKLAESDEFVAECKHKIMRLLKHYTVGYSEHLKTAFDVFSECSVYIQLNSRGVLIERVPEARESRPDFRVKHCGEEAYCEVKTLGWADGMQNYDAALNDGIAARIEIEEQVRSGVRVPIATSGIAPFGQSEELSTNPGKLFARKIIDKLKNNIKGPQFELGATILICDLSLLYLPSPSPRLASMIAYMAAESCCIVSGELWHVAFGRMEDQILKRIEFEGAPNTSGRLERNGILIDSHENLKALIICTSPFDKAKKTYSAFATASNFDKFGALICQMSDFYNDEVNSNAWEIIDEQKQLRR